MNTTTKQETVNANTNGYAGDVDRAWAASHGYVRGLRCDECGVFGDLVLSANLLLCACCSKQAKES